MTRRSKTIVASWLALLTAYAAVAASSLPRSIARQSPERASYFRPPWFNFASKYEGGDVLGFRIGSSTEELVRRLAGVDMKSGVVEAACGKARGTPPLSIAESLIATTDEPHVRDLVQREVLCLWLPERRISLIFKLSKGQVRAIDLSFVRNELI